MSAFPASKLLAASKAIGPERIRQGVSWVAQADADVKGATGLEPETVLEVLVARLARLHRAAGRG
jgi:DNA polymerase-3 subunit delta